MKNVEDIYPLTPTQAGMLFQCLRDDDPELYFEQVKAGLEGPPDIARLEAAFTMVTARHPALRTAIVWDGLEQPVQAVRTTAPITVESIDGTGMTPAAVERLVAQRRQTAFDFTQAPLQRLAVLSTTETTAGQSNGSARTTHYLIWEFSHLICDGWSAGLVLDEVLAAYNGTALAADPPPFREFLAWHGKQDTEADLAFWTDLLDDFEEPSAFQLPHSTEDDEFRAGSYTQLVEAADGDLLETFARSQRITMNTLVQGAWAIVQSRYSGKDDVVFGVTTSGRPAELPDVERIVGMFLNTLPMRVRTEPARAVVDYLKAVQEQQLGANEHSATALASLLRVVGIPAGEDLFETVLIFENYPRPPADPGAELRLIDKTVFEQTNYPLTLMVGVEKSRLELVAHYDANRFSDAQVRAIMDLFASVLKELPTATTVGDLPSLSAVDSERIDGWQGRQLPVDQSLTIGEMLLAQAAITPDATALIEGGQTLTFAELVERANAIATALAGKGVTTDVPVGIAVPRGIDMVVAVVGTVLAGGVYLPLDPKYPPARLEMMIRASGASVVLADSVTRKVLPEQAGVTVLEVAQLVSEADGAGLLAAGKFVQPAPSDTVMLTFTSGSTGVPKGVRLHHAGVLNRLAWQWDKFPLHPGEVFAHKTTLSFVDHLWEIWGGLLAGHSVLLIADEIVTDPELLVSLLADHSVRRLSLVPSLLDVLMEFEPRLAQRLPELTHWSVSGEALAVATAERFAHRLPEATLINLYGMSEASQDATFCEINGADGAVSIGRPIANMKIDLVDDHDRAVPIGVPGHIQVAGVGLSPGYWDQTEMTAERFFDGRHGRTYRSGDLGRWTSDGVLEYLGRIDDQVKVRGIRIELGEIETALASHAGVDRAVVVGRPTPIGTALAGFVTCAIDGVTLDEAALAGYLGGLLPDVMVPASIRQLDALPLLPNGKVDRGSLSALAVNGESPGRSNPVADTPPIPLSAGDERMLSVWRSVMAAPGLGADDDFFDNGGNSMMAMHLASRIKNDLGLNAPLAQLLRTATPRALNAALTVSSPQAQADRSKSSQTNEFAVPILELDTSLANFFVVHGAGGDVVGLQPLARALSGHLNVVGIQAAGVDRIAALHSNRENMVADYLEAIRFTQPTGPYLIGGFSIGGLIAVEVAHRLLAEGEVVQSLVLFDTFHPTLVPRSIPVSEHLQKLARNPRYGVQQIRERLETRRRNNAHEQVSSGDELKSLEQVKRAITANTIDLWLGHTPSRYEAPVILLSSENVYPIWEGIPNHRGWGPFMANLEIVRTPGDHITLIERENVAALVERLLPRLLRARSAKR